MPDFEFTSPSGTKYKVTGPEGSTPEQAFDVLRGHVAGSINLDRPIADVRADIGKLDEPFRAPALKRWADHYVAKENKSGGVAGAANFADNAGPRAWSRGTFIGPYIDELTGLSQQALHTITGGYLGSPYDEALAYQRAKDDAFDKEYPVYSTAAKIGGGLAGGIGAARTASKEGVGLLSGLVGGPIAAAKLPDPMLGKIAVGAGTGALYGQAAGFGNAEGGDGSTLEQAEKRIKESMPAIAIGAGVGAAAPVVIGAAGKGLDVAGQALSPLMARIEALLARKPDASRTSVGMAAKPLDGDAASGGAASAKPVYPGAEAAAEQMIANQLTRANVPVARLRQQVADADEAARYYSSSRAEQVLAPVDLDPSLQRLAGSAGRQQPEAANTATTFMSARQTGNAPQPLPPEAGLPTRPVMSVPGKNDPPMGQFERVRGALKKALLIDDSKFHGHAKNAYRTEQEIVEAAKREADALYGDAYKASENVDIRGVIAPVMQKWMQAASEEPREVAKAINGALKQFMTDTGPVTNLQRFDKAKQFLDGVIERLFESVEGRNRYVGGVLTRMKNEMLDAIDTVATQEMGAKYKAARDAFGSRMEARDALRMGRDVFKENSDIAADQFAQLTTEGQRKLFRLGLLDGFEQHMGRQKRTADVTQVFESPRIQGILEVVVPRSKGATDTFVNRPERLGQFLANEKSMVETRNVVRGGSPTQRNKQDDDAFDTLSSVVEQFRQSPSLVNVGLRAMQSLIDKMFGLGPETAAAIARKLFTADKAQQEALFRALEQRMGPTRMETMAQMLRDYQQALARAPTTSVPAGDAGQ